MHKKLKKKKSKIKFRKKEVTLKKPDFVFKEKGYLLPSHEREWRFDFKNNKVQLISWVIVDNTKFYILKKTYNIDNKYLPDKIKKIFKEKCALSSLL